MGFSTLLIIVSRNCDFSYEIDVKILIRYRTLFYFSPSLYSTKNSISSFLTTSLTSVVRLELRLLWSGTSFANVSPCLSVQSDWTGSKLEPFSVFTEAFWLKSETLSCVAVWAYKAGWQVEVGVWGALSFNMAMLELQAVSFCFLSQRLTTWSLCNTLTAVF